MFSWKNKKKSGYFCYKMDLHYKNMPIQIYWKFYNFQIKNSDLFHISAQNIDCGYSLEAVLTSTYNLCFLAEIRKLIYTPVNPSFTV